MPVFPRIPLCLCAENAFRLWFHCGLTRGLSTSFGCRLTPLKMTSGERDCPATSGGTPAPRLPRFFWRDSDSQAIRPAQNNQVRPCSGANVAQHAVQVVHASDRLTVERNDHVALAQAGALSRAIGFCGEDDYACLFGQVVIADQAAMDGRGLGRHSDVATVDATIAEQAASDELRRVDSD